MDAIMDTGTTTAEAAPEAATAVAAEVTPGRTLAVMLAEATIAVTGEDEDEECFDLLSAYSKDELDRLLDGAVKIASSAAAMIEVKNMLGSVFGAETDKLAEARAAEANGAS